VTYLQAHMTRRHPDYIPSKRREHDVDVEKETQRLKDELNKKDNELQLIKVQKVCSKGKQEFRRTDFGSRLLAAEGEGCV
jgi:hypothetical protein